LEKAERKSALHAESCEKKKKGGRHRKKGFKQGMGRVELTHERERRKGRAP